MKVLHKIRTSFAKARGFGNLYVSPSLQVLKNTGLFNKIEQTELYPHTAKLGRLPNANDIRTICVPKFSYLNNNSEVFMQQSTYLGLDHTNRYGNYISHTMVPTTSLHHSFHPADSIYSSSFYNELTEGIPKQLALAENKPFVENQEFSVTNIGAVFQQIKDAKPKLKWLLRAFFNNYQANQALYVFCPAPEAAKWAAALLHCFPENVAQSISFQVVAFQQLPDFDMQFFTDLAGQGLLKQKVKLQLHYTQSAPELVNEAFIELSVELLLTNSVAFLAFRKFIAKNSSQINLYEYNLLTQLYIESEADGTDIPKREAKKQKLTEMEVYEKIRNEILPAYTNAISVSLQRQLTVSFVEQFAELMLAVELSGNDIRRVLIRAQNTFSPKHFAKLLDPVFFRFLAQNKQFIVKDKFDVLDEFVVKIYKQSSKPVANNYIRIVKWYIESDFYLRNRIIARYKRVLPKYAADLVK